MHSVTFASSFMRTDRHSSKTSYIVSALTFWDPQQIKYPGDVKIHLLSFINKSQSQNVYRQQPTKTKPPVTTKMQPMSQQTHKTKAQSYNPNLNTDPNTHTNNHIFIYTKKMSPNKSTFECGQRFPTKITHSNPNKRTLTIVPQTTNSTHNIWFCDYLRTRCMVRVCWTPSQTLIQYLFAMFDIESNFPSTT